MVMLIRIFKHFCIKFPIFTFLSQGSNKVEPQQSTFLIALKPIPKMLIVEVLLYLILDLKSENWKFYAETLEDSNEHYHF